MRDADCGRAAMSRRGYIGPASERADARRTVRMMPTRIPDVSQTPFHASSGGVLPCEAKGAYLRILRWQQKMRPTATPPRSPLTGRMMRHSLVTLEACDEVLAGPVSAKNLARGRETARLPHIWRRPFPALMLPLFSRIQWDKADDRVRTGMAGMAVAFSAGSGRVHHATPPRLCPRARGSGAATRRRTWQKGIAARGCGAERDGPPTARAIIVAYAFERRRLLRGLACR